MDATDPHEVSGRPYTLAPQHAATNVTLPGWVSTALPYLVVLWTMRHSHYAIHMCALSLHLTLTCLSNSSDCCNRLHHSTRMPAIANPPKWHRHGWLNIDDDRLWCQTSRPVPLDNIAYDPRWNSVTFLDLLAISSRTFSRHSNKEAA